MSLGSRITKRGKAAIVASLASTPREPLLFLYPQWIRKSSTTPEPTFLRHGRPSLLSSRHYTIPSAVRFTATAETVAETPHETDPVENELDASSDQNADGQSHGEKSVEKGGPLVTIRNVEADLRMTGVKIRTYVPTKKDPYASAKLRLKISKAMRDREQAQINTQSKMAVRQKYQAFKREQKQSWIPDWRVILADLRKHTPQNDEWLHNAVYISVPEIAVGTLLHGVDDNMWDIAERYGCSVELASRDTITEQFNEFLLSGPAQAISKTTAEVMRIAPKSKIKAGPPELLHAGPKAMTPQPITESRDDVDSAAKVRNVRSESRLTAHATRPEKIQRPSKWTTRTLADYVDNVTSTRLPNHMHHLLYKKGEDHVKSTVKILREIITNPEFKASMSRTAFKKALDYFMKTSYIADAKGAFVHMEMMGIQMDPEVFNILLRGAAKNEDLHNFHFILHLMLRRGISPNGQTWLAFLMANVDFRIKTHIMAAMKEKGLLGHISVFRGVCEQLVSQEVSASLDLGKSQDEFLKHMDSRYGPYWLTVDSGNRVLHFLGARYLISHCWEFLQTMEARRVKIDQVSINTVLNHCKKATNVAGAIEFMKRLSSLTPVQPDQDTYHALFELAWRTRTYNLARVVWKYACLNASTSRRMRMLVRQSLKNAVKMIPDDPSLLGIWKRQIGIVAISTVVNNHPTLHFPAITGDAAASRLELESTSGMLFSMAGMYNRYKGVRQLLELELEVFHGWVPTRPFGEMLEEAWERDQNWRVLYKSEWPELDWKLRGAIAVPMLRRNKVEHPAVEKG